MKKTIAIILAFFLVVSCTQKTNNKINENTVIAKSDSSENKANSGMKISSSKLIREHPFSNQNKKDTFVLLYDCNNLEDSMTFEIISFSGAIIYRKGFLGTAFYDYSRRPWYEYISDPKRGKDFDPEKLNSQVADSLHKADLLYIQKRMKKFFSDENFMTNPIKKLNKEMLNFSDYKDIKNDSTVIGFSYTLFEGGGFEMIAYSKILRKVKLIASSD